MAKWYPPMDAALCLQQLATFKGIQSIDLNLSNDSGINAIMIASALHSKTLKHVSIDFSGLGVAPLPLEAYKSEVFMSSRKILSHLEPLQLESLQLKNCPNLPEFCRDLGKINVEKLKYFNISFSNIDSDPSFQGGIYEFVSKSPSIQYFNFSGVALHPALVRDIMKAKPHISLPPSVADPEGAIADIRSSQLIEKMDQYMKAPLGVIAIVLDYLNPNIQVELIGGVDGSAEGMDYGFAVEQALAI